MPRWFWWAIGKEMEETYKEMENDSFYSSLMAQAEKEEDAAAILQYLQCYYRERTRIPEK